MYDKYKNNFHSKSKSERLRKSRKREPASQFEAMLWIPPTDLPPRAH